MVAIISWNVNGFRSVLGKGFHDFVQKEKADLICLQEIKARSEQISYDFGEYVPIWNSAQRPGYSGTAILSKMVPISAMNGLGIEELDQEGRVITLEFGAFYLVNVYTPNSRRDLGRLPFKIKTWNPAFLTHVKRLEQKKPVIFCGDLNVAHREIDLANPKSNTKNAGFTPEERQGFDHLLGAGFVDSFRHFCPDPGHYTWWSNRPGVRDRNIGWRIDYFMVSSILTSALKEATHLHQVRGSDHCPIKLAIEV